MTVQGIVQGGVVVVPGGVSLPEGTPVSISPLQQKPPAESGGESIPIGKKLADLAQSLQSLPCDLPSDLAANHDHYLHGLPKRCSRWISCRKVAFNMKALFLPAGAIVTVAIAAVYGQQVTNQSRQSGAATHRIFLGQPLEQTTQALTAAKIEFGEGGFAFSKGDPDQSNLHFILDKNHTSGCVFFSKSKRVVTGISMVFFPSRLSGKSNHSWVKATELQIHPDTSYSVRFDKPLTDEELRRLEENRPKPQTPISRFEPLPLSTPRK